MTPLSNSDQSLYESYLEDVKDDELRLKEAKLEVENAKKWVIDSEKTLQDSTKLLEQFKKEKGIS